MGNNDNRVVTHVALNSFITQNGGSPKKPLNADSYAIPFGEFNQYAPIATANSSGITISDYTGIGGGAYTSNQLVIEKDVTWFNYVRPVPSAIAVSPKTTTLDIGTAPEHPTFVQHTATVTAAADADKSVTWSISDPTKASIDQTGKVTAIAEGTVTVTAATVNNLKDTATVTIVRNDAPIVVNPTNISVTASPDATIYVGDTTQCTATVTPANATNKTVTWSSANTGVATVNASGLVTGVSVGTAVITATSNADNTVKGTVTITVVERPPVTIDPTGITVAPKTNTLNIGTDNPVTTVTLIATVAPNNATNKTVTWTSSNPSVATVDSTGKVTAVAVGTCTITAKTANNLSDTASVEVVKNDIPTPTPTYTISWSGTNAKINGSASGSITKDEGSTWSGTVTPDSGYQIDSITATGSQNITKNGNVVSINGITGNVTISWEASQIPSNKHISVNPDNVELLVNQSQKLVATCENVEISDLVWTIENSTIAQVEQIESRKELAWLSSLSGGNTKGRVYDSTDPSVFAEFTVVVTEKPVLDPNDIADGADPYVYFDEYGHYRINNFSPATSTSNNDMNVEITLDWLMHEQSSSIVIDNVTGGDWFTATLRRDDNYTHLCINCTRFQNAIDYYNSLGNMITTPQINSDNRRTGSIMLSSTIDNSSIVIYVYQPGYPYGIRQDVENETTVFLSIEPEWACTSIDWYGVDGVEITNTEQEGHENELGAASITYDGQSITEQEPTNWYAIAHFVDLPDVVYGAYPLANATLKHTQS